MYGMWFLENGVVVFVKQTIMAMVIGSIIIVFLLFPQAVSDSAKEGLLMWFQIVLPSLLPFSIVSSVIMGIGTDRADHRCCCPGFTKGIWHYKIRLLCGRCRYVIRISVRCSDYGRIVPGTTHLQRRSTIYFNVL